MSGLERALRDLGQALPDDRIVTDPDVLAQYDRDESEAEPRMPGVAVRARSTAEVASVLRAAHAHGVPVTPRAAGTGRVGGAVPEEGGIVLLTERLDGLRGIEREEMIAVAGPGVVTGDLHRAVEAEGLFYPPDPNSWTTCTLGGNVATNAGGPRAFKYGVTREYVLGMEVVTATGDILTLGRRTRKGVTGYDLTALMVGSEGTLGVVTEVTVRLMPLPERIATLMVMLPSEEAIPRAVSALLERRLVPRCIELLDGWTLDVVRPEATVPIPRDAKAMLIVELDGDDARLDDEVERCGNTLDAAGAQDVLVARHGSDREKVWAARREMSRSLRKLARHKMSEDVVVPRTRLAELLTRVRHISDETGIRMPAYGHAGDGNLHVNFLWDDESEWPRVERGIRSLFEQVIAMGGTLSGEHGIGLVKAPYLSLEQPEVLIDLQRRLKAQFDPKGILNPGKIFGRGHGAC